MPPEGRRIERNRIHAKIRAVCGIVGLIGCVGLVSGLIAGMILVDPYDPISDTVSNLAAGHRAWIQDTGLVLFAIGLLACGVGLFAWNSDSWARRLAAALLILLAGDVVVIALHNEYGDGDHEKYVIHMRAVYGFAAMFAAVPALASAGLRRFGRLWVWSSVATSLVVLVGAPAFFVAPQDWKGAYELTLGAVIVAWVGALSWMLLKTSAVAAGMAAPGSPIASTPARRRNGRQS